MPDLERAFAAALLFLFLLSACGAPVRTDLASFQADPAQFEGKEVIFTATLEELVSNPGPYYSRLVEVKGFSNEGPALGDVYWGFVLSDGKGHSIHCYEMNYRIRSWIMPVMAIRLAAQNHEPVTVVGQFEKGGRIELATLTYKGDTMDTNYLPPAPMGYYD